MCYFHSDHFADPLQLKGLASLFRIEPFFFRITHKHALIRAPLQYYETINMFTRISTRGICIRRFPYHPTNLAMTYCVRGITSKCKICRKNKISLDLFIQEMEFIMIEPNIVARAGYVISLRGRIVGCRTRQFWVPYIKIVLKNTNRMLRKTIIAGKYTKNKKGKLDSS